MGDKGTAIILFLVYFQTLYIEKVLFLKFNETF